MGQVVREPLSQTVDCEVFSIDAAMTLCLRMLVVVELPGRDIVDGSG